MAHGRFYLTSTLGIRAASLPNCSQEGQQDKIHMPQLRRGLAERSLPQSEIGLAEIGGVPYNQPAHPADLTRNCPTSAPRHALELLPTREINSKPQVVENKI